MSLKKELVILLGIGIVSAVIFGPWWWQPVSPCVIGDMTARARAQVPDVLKEIYFDAKKIQFGLGSAAIGGWDGLGDAVVVGGAAWVRTTNTRSPNYYLTVSNRYFQSNGLVYIAPERASELSWRLPPSLSLARLWEALAKQNSDGVLFAGYVRLAPLRLIAIARAAIDGRPVLKNAPSYYTRPMESAPEAWVYIAGIAAANAGIARPDRTWLSAMFATDRAGPGAGLAHALWLKSAPGDFHAPPARDNVIAVGQLVADVTLMEGELKLYPITRAGECNAVALAQ
ncbi:MAG: hypothetical protein Q7J84_01775 [Sulfuricaulis sp.]|nr:hypothetical protein [Sulfuricaulis sp.]